MMWFGSIKAINRTSARCPPNLKLAAISNEVLMNSEARRTCSKEL